MKTIGQTVLVTGANGLIGEATIPKLLEEGAVVIACSRSGSESANITTHKNLRRVMLGNISATTDWSEHLSNIDCVVHCIGASTVKPFSNLAPLDEFNYVNRDITLNLAKQAKMAGVAKFIYLSTIKVNGEKSDTAIPLKPQDHPNPESHYGISKWNAEQAIRKLALPLLLTFS